MAQGSEPFVRFSHVDKAYDRDALVVRDLNLDVADGEFLTLLGPSGSGKTTTLMMLAGFEEPTRGSITLNGQPLNGMPAYKRGIGMVFQNYSLFPHMTVAQNLAFPLDARGKGRDEQKDRIARALDMVRLRDFADRRPTQLSGGQQQRVALARALVFEPKLVLMDEPLGALDKQLRDHMQLEIRQIHQNLGVTIVYVTHDQTEALVMSDRVAVFNDGRIQQIASPLDIYSRPETAFVAQFIGENNRLTGSIEHVSGEECLVRLSNGDGVVATPIGDAKPGEKCILSVRPEAVVLGADDRQPENRFKGIVREVVYLGDHLRLIAEACGIDDLLIRVGRENTGEIRVGQEITFGWLPSDCRALPG